MIPRVFVDANVLYSRTLRDWVLMLRLFSSGTIFQLHTTEDVIAETLYHLRRDHPKWNGLKIADIRQKIVGTVDELVGEYDLEIEYEGPDPDDRHVHAAAMANLSNIVLTCDTGLLNMPGQDELPYELYSPDDFFVLIDDSSSRHVMRVVDAQRTYWAKRPGHPGLVVALEKAGCPEFAKRVEGHLKTLSGLSDEAIAALLANTQVV